MAARQQPHSTCSPTQHRPISATHFMSHDHMATLLLLHCRWCFTVIYIEHNCSQHVTAALLAVYLEPLTCSCTLQSQLICSVVITLCMRLLFTVKRWGVHACRTTCACSASYMQYVHHRVWPWPLSTHRPAAAFCVINGDECRSVVVPLIAQKQDIDCC